MSKQNLLGLILGIIVTLLIFCLWFLGAIKTWENKCYDYRFHLRGPIKCMEDIVIIAIDEKSIARFGRWPWSRKIIAHAIQNLTKAGVKVIGIDIIFSEYSEKVADRALVEAIKKSNRVISVAHFDYIPEKVVNIISGKPVIVEKLHTKLVYPFKELFMSSKGIGFINVYPDEDGILRRVKLMHEYNGNTYYFLGYAIAMSYAKEMNYRCELPRTDNILLNFYGKNFISYSFKTIYDGKFPQEWVKDKIVLIGSTAVGTFDHYPTPLEKMYPGVMVHATVIDNLLTKRYNLTPINLFNGVIIILIGLVCGMFFPRIRPGQGAIIMPITILSYFLLTQWLFTKKNIYFEFVPFLMTVSISYLSIVSYRFIVGEKEKLSIKRIFSQYLSPQIMNEVLSDPIKLKLGGERKNLTVLFCDICSFTPLSEKLSPEEVVELLNEYFTAMTHVIFKYDGTVNKFIGDAIMAFWGAPLPQQNHPERAVLCALEMIHKLKILQEKWLQQNKPIIDIGVGINTGEMIVGNMGSDMRMEYTVIGDNVNLASRLQELTREHKVHIIISEDTYMYVKDIINVHFLGQVKIRGREKEAKIYSIVGAKK